ncbi:3-phosphoshikimate 1-carboxyvinyltransferase [Candidatus Peregrinibacteria bacterium]|nr:3-phosphoshikimate 1-carboxyvinyltransferase [Candidatus Peregrinibacteria bacterium]
MQKLINISIPGSKSLSNRALVLAVLRCGTTTTIKNIAICDDTNYTVANLKKIGIKIQQHGTTVKVAGVYKNSKLNFPKSKKIIHLYTGNAGTTTRFLTALAPLTGKEIIIDGDTRMRERPIEELVKALNQLGAKIISTNGYPPLHIFPKNLKGGTINLPGNISSQYLSAMLMIAPFAEKKIIINISTELYSKPYIAMTLKVMEEFGFKIENKNFKQFIIQPNKFIKFKTKNSLKYSKQKSYTIESDASSASYFGAYAAIHPQKKFLLQNIHRNSLQGDVKFLEYLERMGCKISKNKDGIIVEGSKNLKCLGTVDMNQTPDLVMTFAVLGLFTKGKTRITNIKNLRIKETDRLTALENEIKKLGADVKTGKDWIEIQGLVKNNRLENPAGGESKRKNGICQLIKCNDQSNPQKAINISTYNDHRIAMAFGILIDPIPNLKIENPSCVSKSYPNFWEDLKKVTMWTNNKSKKQYVKSSNIVLTGLRGSGKSKIGAMLALKLNMNFVDIDEEIENEENTGIPDIVAIRGWEYFRAVENKVTKKVAKLKNTVISTGGGTIIDPENEKMLKKNGKIIYLYVKPQIAASRILNSKNRPPLTNKESVEEEMKHLYKQRKGRYYESAHIIFKRSKNTEKDCAEIIKKLKN